MMSFAEIEIDLQQERQGGDDEQQQSDTPLLSTQPNNLPAKQVQLFSIMLGEKKRPARSRERAGHTSHGTAGRRIIRWRYRWSRGWRAEAAWAR